MNNAATLQLPDLLIDLSGTSASLDRKRIDTLLKQGMRALILTPESIPNDGSFTAASFPDELLFAARLNTISPLVEQLKACLKRLEHDQVPLAFVDATARGSDELTAAKEEGLVGAWCFSAHSPEQALSTINEADVTTLEHPFSLLDQRALDALFDRAEERNVSILARNPFFGRALFDTSSVLSPNVTTARDRAARWARRNQLDLRVAALRFCFSQTSVAAIVLDDPDEETLTIALDAAKQPPLPRHKLSDAFPIALDASLIDSSAAPQK